MELRKKRVITFLCSLIFVFSFAIIATSTVNPIVDNANLLTEDEISNLKNVVEEIRSTYNMDTVIVTEDGLGGKSPEAYADDYYDYNGYGIDSDKSGLLLLIDMDNRDIYISTTGKAIDYFTDVRIESMVDDVSKYLSNGKYYDGCNVFLSDIKYYIDQGIPAGQHRVEEGAKTSTIIFIALGIGLVSAAVASIIVVNSYKNPKSTSSLNYVDRNSIKFTNRRDTFVRTYTTKTKIERNDSSGNSSSTHTSSSGTTHGGGGGKF